MERKLLLVVLDLWPNGLGEWAHGVFELQCQKTQGDHGLPWLCYHGQVTDKAMCEALQADLQERVMAEWWERHPEAGPAGLAFDPH